MHPELEQPIFIGGAGRSGTTLLRVMLDAHPRIACGPELKILPELAGLFRTLSGPLGPVMASYGNTPDDVAAELRLLVAGLTGRFRRNSGKPRWAEKTPHNCVHMVTLGALFPDARFLHVIRDGRDVACSLLTMNWQDAATGRKVEYTQSIGKAARYWRQIVAAAREQARHSLLTGRVLEIRYENLVAETEPTLRRILEFVGEPWDDAVLAHEKESSTLRSAVGESSTDQTARPVYTSAVSRWQRDMSLDDKREFKREAGGLLQELGYCKDDDW